jgi:hypothetical protein
MKTEDFNKKGVYIVCTLLAFLIPLIISVLFWWTIAVLYNFKIVKVVEQIVAISAITGLTIGILMDSKIL